MENIDLNNGFSDTRPQMWTSDEIRELILYAKELEIQVEDKTAQLIMMNTKYLNMLHYIINLNQQL